MSASVVYRGREIWAGGLGVKSKEHGGHPLSSTVYRIGSVSKVFVVIADRMYVLCLININDYRLSWYIRC